MKPYKNKAVIASMVKFYGTIEKAREEYSKLRNQANDRLNPKVLWVAGNGQIKLVGASEVFYKGSTDAFSVLPK